MASSSSCSQFDCQKETIDEFIQRFTVQCSDQLAAAGDDGIKKAAVLVKALPINVITDLQRRLKPVLLSAATYDQLISKLTSQYEVKQSIVGATVKFLNYKQSASESIESYAKNLNDLASACKFSDCCRDRSLRDAFVSGLYSSAVLRAVLQDCEDKTFNDCVDKAKLIEQLTSDAQDIKLEPKPLNSPAYKLSSSTNSTKLHNNYVCIRCGAKKKHLASQCYALKLTCNSCKKTGHLSKMCRTKKSQVHSLTGDETSGSSGATSPAAEHSCDDNRGVGNAAFHVDAVRGVAAECCHGNNSSNCNSNNTCCDQYSFLE